MTPRQSPRVTEVTTGLLGHRYGTLLSGESWPITFSDVKCKHPHTTVLSILSLQMNGALYADISGKREDQSTLCLLKVMELQ